MIDVKVTTAQAWVQGRNQLSYIQSIQVWGGESIFIDGISQRGQTLNAGFGGISPDEMDLLSLEWLKQRGLLKQVLEAGNRLERLVDDLSEYAHPDFAETISEVLGEWAVARYLCRHLADTK